MSVIQIRPVVSTDLKALVDLDHSCSSDYVWQMDLQRNPSQVSATFREIRLPRSVMLPYPKDHTRLAEEWNRKDGFFMAVQEGAPAGYLHITNRILPQTGWITDVVVATRFRRQGVASALVMHSFQWAQDHHDSQVILEMSSKNNAAIRMAQKLGFEYCGYNDHYYPGLNIALFFNRELRP